METPELNPIDRHFAALLQRIAPNPSPELEIAAQLLSRFQADGHVCLPLKEIKADALVSAGILQPWPRRSSWLKKLRESGVVGEIGEFKPLILDKAERLYLQRYWKYEDDVARNLSARLLSKPDLRQTRMEQRLKQVFSHESQLQKLAAFVAATSNLGVISGAPGTGKTHTVVLICALLIALEEKSAAKTAAATPLKIALAAPTGKAAARLKQALVAAKTRLKFPTEIATKLPDDASTIQRLLGAVGESAKFRHHAENPLRADVVIVDEASMIDLALLAKLLDAVRSDARMILVGDKDQLASVEAGSAFRDICTPGFEIGVSENQARAFEKCTGEKIGDTTARQAPIHDAIVELHENFRFAAGTGIAELSGAINRGDAATAKAILKKGGKVKWRSTPNRQIFSRELRDPVLKRFGNLCDETDPQKALEKLSEFTVLCALRRGPFGAETVNKLIERLLFGARKMETQYFSGTPVMIIRNDYEIGLFNGDIGIVLDDVGAQRVFFPGENGEVRSFAPARLPAHEPAFALTVHKSQGSEFRDALIILPERDAPVLTRELLYTGVTRVRETVELWAGEQVLTQTIGRKIERNSGLRGMLWGEVSASNR